jgi:acetyl esterase
MIEPYAAADGLVRVYPAHEPNGSGLVWAHGGGFAAGDLDMPEADWVARELAARGVTVVSVDYRLAPMSAEWATAVSSPPTDGAHYPAGSDDVVSAFGWAAASGLAVGPWALGGASAGANLATGATLRLIEAAGPVPALVVLAYPTLLAVQPEPDAALRAALDAQPEADIFGSDIVLGMYENYLGGSTDGAPLAAIPGLASPADLAGFPPTLIVNGDVDELRVSGEHFARTLTEAGRDIVVVTELGTQHGHLNRPDEPAASRTIDRIVTRLVALTASNPHIDALVHTSARPGSVDSRADAWVHGAVDLTAPTTEGSPA